MQTVHPRKVILNKFRRYPRVRAGSRADAIYLFAHPLGRQRLVSKT